MAQGGAIELNRMGDAQKMFHTYGRGEPGVVVGHFRPQSKTARVVEHISAVGAPQNFSGTTLEFKIPPCQGYVLNAGLAGILTPCSTLQANPFTTTDTIAYKDDAHFLAINEFRMWFGCNNNDAKPITGQLMKIMYDYYFNADQRLGKSVFDGSEIERVNWSRSAQPFYVPFLYGPFLHYTQAICPWMMKENPPTIQVVLNTMENLVDRYGTAQGAGGVPVAGYSPGELTQVKLQLDILMLHPSDANLLKSNPVKRRTFLREPTIIDVPHSASQDDHVIPITCSNSLSEIMILCENRRYRDPWNNNADMEAHLLANPTAIGIPQLAGEYRVEAFNYQGEPRIDGIHVIVDEPFAGATFELEGKQRWQHTYEELTEKHAATMLARSPTDPKEIVPMWSAALYQMSPFPGNSIQLTRVQDKQLTIHRSFQGISKTAWTGRIKVVLWTWQILTNHPDGTVEFSF